MKITNKYNLPDEILEIVKKDPYSRGDADYSVSDLISPPRKHFLETKFDSELEVDVHDLLPSMMGQAVHVMMERANKRDIVERRLFHTVLEKKISGAMDWYNPKTGALKDWKNTKVSKFSFSDFQEWEWQMNCYAQLLRWNNDKITSLEIGAFVSDYRPQEHENADRLGKPYPLRWMTTKIPLWEEPRATRFITDRVVLHELAKHELPECTASERWARASTWAVKKPNQKRALDGHSNYATERTAQIALEYLPKGHYIEHRPGRNTRCEKWCPASKVCDQFKTLSSQ